MNKHNNKPDLIIAFSLHVLNLAEIKKKQTATTVVLGK
jgi:hypothetical protein